MWVSSLLYLWLKLPSNSLVSFPWKSWYIWSEVKLSCTRCDAPKLKNFTVVVLRLYRCSYSFITCVSALVLQIANMVRFMIDSYSKPLPAILEIPSKDHPYDPNQDSILSRVKHMFSSDPSGPSDRKWVHVLELLHALLVCIISLFSVGALMVQWKNLMLESDSDHRLNCFLQLGQLFQVPTFLASLLLFMVHICTMSSIPA